MSGLERVRCLRCGSNCFPGSNTCWNCGASLPPPEDMPNAAARAAGAPAGSVMRPAFGRAWVVLVVTAIAVVCAVGGYALLQRRVESGMEGRQAQLEAVKERLMRERFRDGAAPPMSSTADPTEAQARRELDRLRGQLESMPTHGPGSDIRLRLERQRR